ncbi:hypothetical protein BE21_44650 [Sorangium cellulosum]|uniref:Uncharacterized protein n=1 Tax=Sorangium cellulosum TaxID=56 RepID=A0A150TJC5_SORCE|nr:hypothetical protein BE21_44650 [Sorangium cellulosum]
MLIATAAAATIVACELPPETITVLDRNDAFLRGYGDEVSVGLIRFLATFGQAGSVQVTVDDRFAVLAEDVDNGGIVTLPAELGRIGQLDFGGAPIADWQADVLARDAPVAVGGTIVAALEQDAVGTDTARDEVRRRADRLREALGFYIAGPEGALTGLSDSYRTLKLGISLNCVQAVALGRVPSDLCKENPAHPEWKTPSDGGRDRIIGHDLIGIGGIISLNLVPDDFNEIMNVLRPLAESLSDEPFPSCGDAQDPDFVLCPPDWREISIHFKGNDAHWQLDSIIAPP